MALKVVGSNPIIHPIKIKDTFSGILYFYALNGIRKAVKKTCRWHVFRPWENPLIARRIHLDVDSNQLSRSTAFFD